MIALPLRGQAQVAMGRAQPPSIPDGCVQRQALGQHGLRFGGVPERNCAQAEEVQSKGSETRVADGTLGCDRCLKSLIGFLVLPLHTGDDALIGNAQSLKPLIADCLGRGQALVDMALRLSVIT
jgi:hypothetical protein